MKAMRMIYSMKTISSCVYLRIMTAGVLCWCSVWIWWVFQQEPSNRHNFVYLGEFSRLWLSKFRHSEWTFLSALVTGKIDILIREEPQSKNGILSPLKLNMSKYDEPRTCEDGTVSGYYPEYPRRYLCPRVEQSRLVPLFPGWSTAGDTQAGGGGGR